MERRLSLVVALLIFTHPLLLHAATTECPQGKTGTGCVYKPSPVIERLIPTLSAAPISINERNVIAGVNDVPDSPPALKDLCNSNKNILPTLAQSPAAAMIRKDISLICRDAANRSGAEIRSFSLTLTADQAALAPQGTALSLEQRVLVGVTDFVVARAQQELVDYMVTDFSKKLCDPKAQFDPFGKGQQPVTVDMTQIFPRSCAVLRLGDAKSDLSSNSQPLDLSQLGSTFEQALRQDLHDFPPFFLNAAISGVFCKGSGADCQDNAKIALAVYQAIEAARTGGNPILAVATAAKSVTNCTKSGDRDCGILFLGEVLETFAAQYKTIQTIDLRNSDEIAALVDLVAANVIIKTEGNPNLKPFTDKLATLRGNLQALVAPVRQITLDVSALEGSGLPKEQKVDLSLDIVDNLAKLWNLGLPDITADDRTKLVNIVNDIHDAWIAEQAAEYDRLFAALFSLAKDLDVNFPVPASVQQYLPLITALTTAQKPEDVTAALEKYAAPLGSWRDKQTGQRSVTLNAFAGGTLGATRSTGGGDQAGRLALFVPLGFDFTFNRNLGLFFSVVDLGNLAEIRFHQDDSSTEIPDVHLKEVVSPGLWLRYSIHDTPLALGLGGSLRRQIGSTQATTDTVWQFGFFVAVDVPIFTLYRGGTPK